MFSEINSDIAGYAADNALYYGSSRLDDIIQKLNGTADCLFLCFANSY